MVCRCVLSITVSCLALVAGTDALAFVGSSAPRSDVFSHQKDYKISSSLRARIGVPVSDKNVSETKVAAVCFISDTSACSDNQFGGSGDSDFEFSNKERCFNEGYTISDCPEGYKPGGKRCIYGNYYTECVSACPTDYVTCEEPYVGVGEACGGKYASCTCTPCGEGFDYTEIPEGYEQVGEGCLDCDGQTKYKVTPAACNGFQMCGDLGPVFGTETCLSGTTTLYKECKTCPNIGKYSSSSPECSAPYTCSYEDCSGKYYQSGCVEGFTWDETAKTCTCEGVDWCAITPSCTDLGYKQRSNVRSMSIIHSAPENVARCLKILVKAPATSVAQALPAVANIQLVLAPADLLGTEVLVPSKTLVWKAHSLAIFLIVI